MHGVCKRNASRTSQRRTTAERGGGGLIVGTSKVSKQANGRDREDWKI